LTGGQNCTPNNTQPAPTADLILHRGLFTTLARANPTATAVAIRDGRFLAVGADKEVMAPAGPKTKVVDLKGRRVLPGLIDNHLQIIRAGSTSTWSCAGTACGASPMH
jgi:predicted amidohydrolase YtcJ